MKIVSADMIFRPKLCLQDISKLPARDLRVTYGHHVEDCSLFDFILVLPFLCGVQNLFEFAGYCHEFYLPEVFLGITIRVHGKGKERHFFSEADTAWRC
jgi:hypothetical protein